MQLKLYYEWAVANGLLAPSSSSSPAINGQKDPLAGFTRCDNLAEAEALLRSRRDGRQ